VLTLHPCSAYRGSAEVLNTGEVQRTHASRLAEAGLKDLSELSVAKQRMEARLRGIRSGSKLPQLIELFLCLPLLTVPLAARSLNVSQQAVEAMMKTLGPSLPREVIGGFCDINKGGHSRSRKIFFV
jgi:HTH DNA binding domain